MYWSQILELIKLFVFLILIYFFVFVCLFKFFDGQAKTHFRIYICCYDVAIL